MIISTKKQQPSFIAHIITSLPLTQDIFPLILECDSILVCDEEHIIIEICTMVIMQQ